MGGRQGALKEHGLGTFGTQPERMDIGRGPIGVRFRLRHTDLTGWLLFEYLLQGEQVRTEGGGKETEVADLDKAAGQDMLQKTVDEFFSGEGAAFEGSRAGRAIGESDLGRFHTTRVEDFD